MHEKLACRLTKLRRSTCEAVLWEEFDKLSLLAKASANINVTAVALAESGVGFLVADTSLWRLGGDTALAYAEQAKNAWKCMAKQELNQHKVVRSCWTPAFLQPRKQKCLWMWSRTSRRGCKRLTWSELTLRRHDGGLPRLP